MQLRDFAQFQIWFKNSNLLGSHKIELTVAKDIIYTLTSNQSMSSSRGVVKTLGVDKQNIKRAMGRQVQLNIIQNALWINHRQASCSNVLRQENKDVIIDWWTKKTTISLNKKDVMKRKIVVKHFEEHPKHFLQVSQVRCIGLNHIFEL